MQPKHDVSTTMGFLKRQKYYFAPSDWSDWKIGWNLALTTLFPEPEFHTIIESHGIQGCLESDWAIKFKATDGGSIRRDGPRYSRLCKSLWDAFGPLFDEYGVKLMNRYTGQPVPIKTA
jgi:hypothetical protein